MLPTNRLFLLCVLLFSVTAFARTGGIDVALLPGHVEAPVDEISLIADYELVQPSGRIPVYLVNRTSADIVLQAQDGDIYLKLEHRDDDGDWIRAQPHAYSWCGNSYFEWTLESGHYALLQGYQPRNGVVKEIRFRLYSQDVEITSNPGTGLVAAEDVRRAASDVMSVNEGSFDYVARIASSEEPVINDMDHVRDLRLVAIQQLASGRFDPDASRKVLMRIRDRGTVFAEDAEWALQALEQSADD